MADKSLEIILEVNIPKSVAVINQRLKEIEKLVKKLDIEISVDGKTLQTISNEYKKFNEIIVKHSDVQREREKILREEQKIRFNMEKQAQREREKILREEQKIRRKLADEQERIMKLQDKNAQIAHFKEGRRVFNLGDKLTSVQPELFIGKDNQQVESNLKNFIQSVYGANSAVVSFQKSMDSAGNVTYKAVTRVKEGARHYKEYTDVIDKSTKALYQQKDAIKTMSGKDMGFIGQLQTAMERIPVWIAGMEIFYSSIHFFTEGARFINEINKSMTEISIVTGKSQEQVMLLAKEYNNLAREMKVTTQEIASASVEFYRQGLSDEQVVERMKIATQYAKIAGIEFRDASKILTASANSFNIDMRRVADVMAYLGDATATGRMLPPMLAIA